MTIATVTAAQGETLIYGELMQTVEFNSYMTISTVHNPDYPAVLPQIKQAEYAGAYSVSLLFSDGAIKKVNFGDFLKKTTHPKIRFYLDEREFKKF